MTGQGGGPTGDGQEGGPYCLGNVANVPVEVIEAENPVLVEEYSLLPDTGGPGEFRGALGIVRQYRFLATKGTVQLRSDRKYHQPWGLEGGGCGAPGNIIRNPCNNAEEQPSKFVLTFHKDEVLRGEMPGSGGWGDPLKRDTTRVAEDIRQEKISAAHAEEVYGVIVDPDTFMVNEVKTLSTRAVMRKDRQI